MTASSVPVLHGVSASPFVRKVRIALVEKSIEYRLEPVMPFAMSDAFLAISPLAKVPVYQDGDFALPDSSCILAYLERLHPEPPLFPSEARALGRALFYEEFADTRGVDALGPIFFERVVNAKVMKTGCDESIVKEHLDFVAPPIFDWLEGELANFAEGDEGIVDGRFGVADLGLITIFINLEHGGESVDAQRWPKLASYVRGLMARPSIRAIYEEERASFASM